MGELEEDSFKKIRWSFVFSPETNSYGLLNEEVIPLTLIDFYTMVLCDAEKKNLLIEQDFTYFMSCLKEVETNLKLDGD